MFAQNDKAEEIVNKTFCSQAIDYTSLDELKIELLTNAKREAVNELFGEKITAYTAIENFVLTSDQIRASSLGLVRVEGDVRYFNGSNLADVCISVTAYVTPEDRHKFEPFKLTKRNCVTEPDLTTRQIREYAKEQAVIQAMLDYDRKLENYDNSELLKLMQRVNYTRSGFVPETETYCISVEGYITPIEIITLLDSLEVESEPVNEKDDISDVDDSLQEGLVAYFPFNGNANDQSGNGNHGTVQGATLITDVFGISDGAYEFDGVDDNIVVPDDSTLFSNDFSISLWIRDSSKNSSINSSSFIFSQWKLNGDKRGSLIISTDIHNNLSFTASGDGIAGGNEGLKKSVSIRAHDLSISHGNWHHIVAIFKGGNSGYLSLYFDNKLVAKTGSLVNLFNATSAYSIGGHRYSAGDRYFPGAIDELRLYNRVLSDCDIQKLYSQGSLHEVEECN